jgi:hypothetical protein
VAAAAAPGSQAAPELEYLLYCQQTLAKKTMTAETHIRAHTRKRPQKLARLSRTAPNPLSSTLQLGCVNHLS